MDLQAAEQLARELIAEHSPTGWRFKWDRAVGRFGQTNYATRVVSLSRPLTVQRDPDDVRDTILHEIAHTLTYGHNHDRVWQRVARELGSSGNRASSGKGLTVPHKWLGTCPNGHTAKRSRLSSAAREGSCPSCSPRYNPAYRFEWKKVG